MKNQIKKQLYILMNLVGAMCAIGAAYFGGVWRWEISIILIIGYFLLGFIMPIARVLSIYGSKRSITFSLLTIFGCATLAGGLVWGNDMQFYFDHLGRTDVKLSLWAALISLVNSYVEGFYLSRLWVYGKNQKNKVRRLG